MLFNLVIVGCVGFIGAALRYFLSWLSNIIAFDFTGAPAFLFPLGTFAANLLGCFFMGYFAFMLPHAFPGHAKTLLFVTTGIMGGFTTFSTFALDTYNLFSRGECLMAGVYLVVTLAVCFAGLVAGIALAKATSA